MKQQTYRKLISGQSNGFGAYLLRLFLKIIAIGYSFIVRLRNLLYSKGLLNVHHVDAAVFCIGNITVGGTGKTPLVVWLCNLITQNSKLKTQNCKCAILTRGYKATNNRIDEPAILIEICPKAKVIVNPDRVEGAAEAIYKYAAKVLVMDDGFQHRRLSRDLDIVTIDATQPFGYDKLLPAGLLREPASSLKRAGAVVITRSDQVTETNLSKLEQRLKAINPDMVIAKSIHSPAYAKSKDGKEISIEQLKGKKVFAFCGIGNPNAFFNTIKNIEAELVGSKAYDDHFHYTEACLIEISKQAEEHGADLILTTQKDWTKVANTKLAISESHRTFAYLAVEIKFLAGEDKLTNLIKERLADKILQK